MALNTQKLSRQNRLDTNYRRYNLSEIISESYRTLYDCPRSSKLYDLVERHIGDVRRTPDDLDTLSKNLHALKQLVKLGESAKIDEDAPAGTSPDETWNDEVGEDKVEELDKKDVIEGKRTIKKKAGILTDTEEIELAEARARIKAKKRARLNAGKKAPTAKKVMKESNKWKSHRTKMIPALKNFRESSNQKAFYKTLNRMSARLKEDKPLDLQESLVLYKAANSAMTHLAVELEHNPGFMYSFNECTSLLSRDTNRLLHCIKENKSPSVGLRTSLRSFINVLTEAEEDEWEDILDEIPAEDEDELVPDTEEASDEVEDEESEEVNISDIPGIIEDAIEDVPEEEIEATDIEDVTEEELEDLTNYLIALRTGDAEAGEDDEESESAEDFVDPEDEEITDEELDELKKHLAESRRRKMRESKKIRSTRRRGGK